MLKCRKSILFFTFLFVLLAVGVMAINDGVDRDVIKADKAEKALLEKPTLSSSVDLTPQGQVWNAELQAKYDMIAKMEAEQMMELEGQADQQEVAMEKEIWRPGKGPFTQKEDFSGKIRASKIVAHPVVKHAPNTVFVTEDFEGETFPPADWDTVNTDPGYGFFANTFSGGGTQAALVTWHAAGYQQDEWLLTPALDVSSSTAADLVLEFWMLQGYSWPHDFNIQVSTDGGANWTLMWNSLSVPYPAHEWYFVSLDISAYATETNLMFGFQYYGVDADLFGLDDIAVHDEAYVEPTGRCCSGDPYAPTCADGMTEAECDIEGGTWAEGLNCIDDPCPIAGPNDNCADVTPELLPFTFVGNNEAATYDTECQYFGDYPNVWTAFTLTEECSNITISYCGTQTGWANGWLNLITDCSCEEGTLVSGATYDFDCANGNFNVYFAGLDAGNYYYPVMLDPGNGAVGDYSIEITAVPCPAAPDNDDCADAEAIGDVVDYAFSTESATPDNDGYTTGPNIWYCYTASCEGEVTVSLCGSSYDTKLAAYDGCDCALGSPLDYNDDDCGLQSEISFMALQGNTYLIEVGGYGSSSAGAGILNISCEDPDPGNPGDNCLDPLKIDIPTLPFSDIGQTTCGRVDDYDNTDLGYYDGGEDIIYEITVSTSVYVNITLDPKSSSYTGIGLFDLCPSDPSAVALEKSTSSSAAPHGIVCAALEPGNYYIMVDTWPSPDCIPEFDLTIEEATGCDAPENDDCANAEVIGDVFELPFNTDLATFDGSGDCQDADNLWYEYTATCDGVATISLCGSSYDTKLGVWDACGGTLLDCNDDACGAQSEVEIYVTVGQVLVIEVGGYSSYTGEGVLTTYCTPPCEVEIPAGAIAEGEPCGDDTNGGCNSSPEVFGTVACGETIHGNGWADGGTRDTDWYELVTTEWSEITVTVSAEFDFAMGFVETAILGDPDCATASALNPFASGDECDIASVSQTVPPGTYWLFVGPNNFYDYPCANGPFDYYMIVDCVPAEPVACDASGGCDEYISNVTVGDINNSSDCTEYGDYTDLSTVMEAGTGYPITVENGNGYSSDDCAIWVDWNGNLDFTDPGERVVMDVETGAGPYSATITPPAEATGDVIMRIRISYFGYVEDMSPCGQTSYGEVEDYTISTVIPVEYVVNPDPVNVFMKFHIGDSFFDIFVGDAAVDGGTVADMTNVSLSVGGNVVASTTSIVPGTGGIIGDALRIRMDVTDYIVAVEATQPDGLVWGMVDSFFDIYYEIDITPNTYTGQAAVVGHTPGDFTLDGNVDIADLVAMVSYMFTNGDAPRVEEVIDVNGDHTLDIGDLVAMVEYMFNDGAQLTHP